MKNIQIVDGAVNATFSLFQATDKEFNAIFPEDGQDIEIIEDFIERVGEEQASQVLSLIWTRPIQKRDVVGLHGTLFYDYQDRAQYLPTSKREIDRAAGQLNEAERFLFAKIKGVA